MSKMIIVEGNSNDKDNTKVFMVKGEKGDPGDVNTEQLNAEKSARINADDNLQSQISSLASGSPLVASSTSEMTNTTRVYVNTTDGNWYYYNGSAWVSGGTYQSTGIAEDSVDMSMLTDEVKYNMLTGNLAYYNLVPGYYNYNGVFVQQTENEEVTTGEIYVNNASYVNISADVETTYSFWSGVTFFDEEDNFISRETYVSGAGYENNKMCIKTIPEDTAYCRFSYRMSPGIKYIYFSTNTINNIYRSVVNNNLDGYSVMYEGVAEVVRKELIEGYTNKYNITYKLPYRCDIYDKSNHIANLSYKEFTIPQILEGNNREIKNNYFLYYDLKTEEIKWRSMDSTAWFNTQSEFKDYVLIGFVNNNYGVISLYGNNFKVERQTNLCSIANGRVDGTLPTIENNHFKLAQDTLIFYNNTASGFNQYNHVTFSDGVDVDLSTVDSTLIKIFYIKQLDRVVWVKYSDWNYVDSNGDVYELTVDNSIYIALIRTSQKFMSINSPYIYDGKLFGLDLKHYAFSKLDLATQKRIGTLEHPEYEYSLMFIITDKLPKGTKFSFKGSENIYKWSVVEVSSDEIPNTQSSYPPTTYNQTDSGWLYAQHTYTSKYNGYKVVHLAYQDATKEISTDEVFNEYFTVSLPYNSYEDSVLKEINNLNLDEKLNLNLYPSRIGSKHNKFNLTACVLVVDNKLPAGSKINFKQLTGKDYRWAVVEATETFPGTYDEHTIVDSGWKTTNEGEYETTSEAYIFLTLGDKNNQNLTTSNLPDLYASFEIIPNNQINKLENEIEQINYETDKLKLIDVNKNIKAVNHRGFNTVAPENTLPAYKLSKKMGFYYVETDVSFTSDGIPVCIHDQTINRTARNADGTIISGPIAINGITFQEARQYDFGIYKSSDYAGTQIPSLEEFLILCRNLGLQPYIELKNTDTYTEAQIQSLVDLVEKCGMKGKVTWISFTITYLTYVKNYDNKARIGYLNDINSSSIASALELKTNENEVFLDTYVDNATNEKVNLCIQNNIPLEVWTVDDEPTILNMNPYITGVTSDNLIAGEVLYNNNID